VVFRMQQRLALVTTLSSDTHTSSWLRSHGHHDLTPHAAEACRASLERQRSRRDAVPVERERRDSEEQGGGRSKKRRRSRERGVECKEGKEARE